MGKIPESSFLTFAAYLLGALAVFAVWTFGVGDPLTTVNGDPRSTLPDLVYGKAYNPFVQRALIPALTRAAVALLPADSHAALREAVQNRPALRRECERIGWDQQFLPEHLIALGLAFASLFAWVFAFRHLILLLYSTERAIVNVTPFASLFALVPFFLVGTHYMYDFPALLFFTLGLCFLIERRWIWYYAVFIAGCINKETTVMLTAAFVLISWRRVPWRSVAPHVALQLGLFAAIKGALAIIFSGNPGGAIEWHVHRNLQALLQPYGATSLAVAAALLWLVVHDFRNKPVALRRVAWLLPVYLVLMFCFGLMDEIRTLYEIFPVFFLLGAHTVLFSLGEIPYVLKPSPRGESTAIVH